jgi:hypothetical protein
MLPSYIITESDSSTKFKVVLQKCLYDETIFICMTFLYRKIRSEGSTNEASGQYGNTSSVMNGCLERQAM